MKKFLIALALIGLVATSALADYGFFLEFGETFVPGQNGVLPAVSWEFGYEMPEALAPAIDFSFSVKDPNILGVANFPILAASLAVDVTQSVTALLESTATFDLNTFNQGIVFPQDWMIRVGVEWIPGPFAKFTAGTDFNYMGQAQWVATPYATIRFDF